MICGSAHVYFQKTVTVSQPGSVIFETSHHLLPAVLSARIVSWQPLANLEASKPAPCCAAFLPHLSAMMSRMMTHGGCSTCQHADAGSALPIPDANGLVIRGGDNPGVLIVELHRPDVIQVAQ